MASLTIADDVESGPGWILLTFEPALPPGSDCVVVVRRQTEKPYLGTDGWQAQPAQLVAQDSGDIGDSTVMRFGSEMSNAILIDLAIVIEVPGTGRRHALAWPEVSPAPRSRGSRVDVKLRSIAPEATLVEPSPPQSPVETKAPHPQTPPTPPVDPAPPRRRWWIGLSLIMLIAVAAAIAWYFLQQTDAPPTPSVVEEVEPAPAPEPEQAPDFATRFQTMRDAGGMADELLMLGEEALEAGAVDIGFRSVTLSADRGNAEAMLQLGQWYDPATGDSLTSPNPDAAARYYHEALEADLADAEPPLVALCAAGVEGSAEMLPATLELYCQ